MAMTSMDAANKLEREFGVNFSEARKAVEIEAEALKGDRRVDWDTDVLDAYHTVRGWIVDADEYVVSLMWADIAKFVSSHRQSCVWAVCAGKALKVAKETQ